MQVLTAQQGSDSTENFFTIVAQKDAYYDSLIQIRGTDSMQGTGYKDYLRWKMFCYPRVDDSGSIVSYMNTINNYYDQHTRSLNNDYTWNYFAPVGVPNGAGGGGFGKGWVNRLYYDEPNNILYAGTHNNGIWKTNESGRNN